MKILLIEDEKQLTDALANIFKKEKYSVDIVADGAEGLEFALTPARRNASHYGRIQRTQSAQA